MKIKQTKIGNNEQLKGISQTTKNNTENVSRINIKLILYTLIIICIIIIVILIYYIFIKNKEEVTSNIKENITEVKKDTVSKNEILELPIELKQPKISAFLIFENGSESVNLIDNNNFSLINVFYGDGFYKGQPLPTSNSMKIKIVFTAINHKDKIVNYEITLKEETGTLKKRISDKISGFDNKNNFTVDMNVVLKEGDIGCSPLVITASLTSEYNRKEIDKTIDFMCGE
jgi:hypothetical protein